MDHGRRLNPYGISGNPSQSSLGSGPSDHRRCFSVTPSDPWHSTPVKKSETLKMTRHSSPPGLTTRTTPVHIPLDSQTMGEMEASTIQKQRRELQLLVAELKERDQELNTMAAAHHKQLQDWEQDRQRVLTLEQRCARLDDELHKRNEVIRAVTKRIHVMESREKESHRDLNSTQQQLHELVKKQQYSSQQCQDLEERNQSLNSTVMSLSVQVGSLQVREEELSAMLRLKDKDVTEATNHIVDLSGRLRECEASLEEHRSRESRLLRELEEEKRRRREARNKNARLKEELQEQVTGSSAQREEIIRLKQEGQLLRRELASSGERESRKDELLALARSNQERSESELHCLRQVCANRQNDVQLLQLNLESAHEALRRTEGQGSQGSQRDLTCVYLDDRTSWTRRSPGPANDSASPTTSDYLEDDDQQCSTNRLQRLLDESRQMVASLELTTLRPRSPSHNCDAVLSQDGGSVGSSHPHHRANQGASYHPASQTHQQDSRSPPRGSEGLNHTKEPSGPSWGSTWKQLERHRDELH